MITPKVMHSVNQLTDTNHLTAIFIKLSDRETAFFKLVCTELTYKEIAPKLFLSVRTVKGYRGILCEKSELKTRVGLAMYAIKNNLVSF